MAFCYSICQLGPLELTELVDFKMNCLPMGLQHHRTSEHLKKRAKTGKNKTLYARHNPPCTWKSCTPGLWGRLFSPNLDAVPIVPLHEPIEQDDRSSRTVSMKMNTITGRIGCRSASNLVQTTESLPPRPLPRRLLLLLLPTNSATHNTMLNENSSNSTHPHHSLQTTTTTITTRTTTGACPI